MTIHKPLDKDVQPETKELHEYRARLLNKARNLMHALEEERDKRLGPYHGNFTEDNMRERRHRSERGYS